jgi:hypothetical protein
MSDQEEQMNTQEESIDTGEPLGPVDQALRFEVDITNEGGQNIGVTLLVSGMLVSGITVSADEYFLHIDEQRIDNARFVINGIEASREKTEEYRKQMRERLTNEQEPLAPLRSPSRFIHLRNVEFNTPYGPLKMGEDFWWRIRLDKVEGVDVRESFKSRFIAFYSYSICEVL